MNERYDRTFILYNLLGQIVGVQQYRNNGSKKVYSGKGAKYYTIPDRSCDRMMIYGLDTYDKYKDVYVVEGIFDAIALHKLGLPCIATLGCFNRHIKHYIRVLNNKFIFVCDGDKISKKQYGKMMVKGRDKIVYLDDNEDVDSLYHKDIEKLKGILNEK